MKPFSKSLAIIFALATLHSSACAEEEKAPATGETITLFDGKTLDGWEVVTPKNARFWSVKDGIITASNGDQNMPINTYLATTKEYGDFEFTCEFRLSGDHETGLINSGIQYRSVYKNHKKRGKIIAGYQADIGKDWWGGIYDEHRRGSLLKGNQALEKTEGFKDDAWHTYKIICKGNHHQLFINDILTAEYTEEDPKIPAKGVFALQLHKGGIAKIEYKNILVKPL